ncbi:MAG: hypothetical protein GY874_19315 [Desulfobacteraceae bacterium]|nr:hypothetical protein [Desulfobacteraceae bacterium]
MKKRCYYPLFAKFILLFAVLVSFFAGSPVLAQVPIEILPDAQEGAKSLDVQKVHKIIRENFDINDDNGPYSKVKIEIVYDQAESPEHLLIYLLNKKYYTFETARIDLAEDLSVKDIIMNYELKEQDLVRDDMKQSYASCPDESVDMVFATCETGIPTAVDGVESLEKTATDQGYNVKTLFGSDEDKQAVYDWLSCENLMLFGRIGHGSKSGIMVDDGVVNNRYFEDLSSSELENKVLFFNSCQVHNSPLEPAVVGAGTQKYIGGKTNLYIGPSEKVFKCWFEKVLNANTSMADSLSECNSQISNAGTFGISGNGSDYLIQDTNPN